MNLKKFVLIGIFALFAAQAQAAYDVVKILSFSCSVCYSTEGTDLIIAKKVASYGGKYVKAPITSLQTDDGSMAKTYYAARKFPGNLASKVNDSFFKASQVMGLQLLDSPQVFAWLQQDLYQDLDEKSLNALMTSAGSAEATASFVRALHIAKAAGVNAIPSYVIMKDGEVVTSVDPSVAPGGPSALRDALFKKLEELNKDDGSAAP